VPGQRTSVMKDIHALLAQDPALTPLDTVEDVLTAGYAQALALEAQQLRLERRLWQLTRERDAASNDAAAADELNQRLYEVESELAYLRTVLVTLRDRARELRAA
jgi:ABC-type phosphate transport system auxiliary subunit